MKEYNILICDDDKDIVNALEIYLKQENYNIFKSYNGNEIFEILNKNTIHLILLDVMMPKLDGINAIIKIRKDYSIPVIFLSARSDYSDKILGLNLGADDYIIKPFNHLELIARIKAQIRRSAMFDNIYSNKNIYQSGGLIINDDTKEVISNNNIINLTRIEYNILKFLIKNKGIVFSSNQIYENVWNTETYGVENIISVHIRHIREKIEIDSKNPMYLKVIWGLGYKIEKYEEG